MTADEIANLIPDEVVEALHAIFADDFGTLIPKGSCRAAFAAGLAAWPGIQHIVWDGQLILHLKAPLSLKEDTDAK